MSEQWAIAITGFGFTAITIVLGWIAVELRTIQKEIRNVVCKDDCRYDMGQHCRRIEELEKTVSRIEMEKGIK